MKTVTELIVVAENMQTLLGRNDAKALQVLRVGLNACKGVRIRAVPTSADSPLEKLENFQLQIPVDTAVTPTIQPFRRIPYSRRLRLKEQLHKLFRLDIIEKVDGAFQCVSPVVLVPKTDKTISLCVDMCISNEAVPNEKYPIPTIDDLSPFLKEASFFSKVDQKMAYHEIKLHPDARKITTFSTPFGRFHYKRLIFGLKYVPEQFQKIIMESFLRHCKDLFAYLDDLLVFDNTEEQHN